jgi:hypothetical protein
VFVERDLRENYKVTLTREHFIRTMAEGNPIHNWFSEHVTQVEKWALRQLEYYPEADKTVVLLGVWLHDIGQSNRANIESHEIYSEIETRRFLGSLGIDKEIIEKVAHCVRTHRCRKDAMPRTLEAKIVAAADSVSHLTDIAYIYMLNNTSSKAGVLAKLERDLRDISFMPEPLKEELEPLGDVWRKLITLFPER